MEKSNSDDSKVSTGMNFEKVLGEMYEQMGYEVEITKGSGDQGADLILVKDGEKTVVQAKYSKSKVSSDAVREAIAAKRFYDADYGTVITNSSFQPNARELAEKDQIEMIDGEKLTAMMSDNDPQEKLLKPISKITFDDIRPVYHNHKKIIRDILRFILRQEERPGGARYRGNEIIKIIRSKLRSELLTKDDVEDMLETILGILKNEYELDVLEQEKEIQMADKNYTETMATLAKNKMPPSDVRAVYEFLEAMQGKTKNPVSEQRLIKQLTLVHYTNTRTAEIIRYMIEEAMIYESSPGHYNTV
jgi:predicted RecB family endonuclease